MSKIKNTVDGLITGVMFGLKNTENTILKQVGQDKNNINIAQEANNNRVSHALLRGELTQEVQELRYRTYEVSREAKKYEYFSPTLAKKIDKQDSKFVSYENSDNLSLITIQPNYQEVEGVNETLKSAEKKGDKYFFKEPKKEYTLKIKRNLIPRFRIEEFTTRIVVFDNDKNNIKFDLYVSIYPDDKNFISKGFVREMQKIMNEHIKSDVVEFDELSFTTIKAYKLDDMLEFVFTNIEFEKIIEYDGYYVVRFKAKALKNGIDKMKEFFNEGMAEKYKNKEKKEKTLDLTEAFTERYVCEKCGKEIFYNIDNIDSLSISKPRYIDEEQENNDNTTEYFDIQIAEQTFGKRLCKDCLKKYIEQLNDINKLK